MATVIIPVSVSVSAGGNHLKNCCILSVKSGAFVKTQLLTIQSKIPSRAYRNFSVRAEYNHARTISLMQRTSMTTTVTSCHFLSGRSMFRGKPPLSYFACPITHGHRTFCTRATNGSDNPASFESPLMESMEKKIKEQLNAESVVVKDAYGDGRHVSIDVISSSFEGQSAVNRQRMVYKAIWEELQERVHAVDQMTTRTPSEAGSAKL
ncbi:hypothetical protein BUALT_Bualt01G0088200 [Buddleja alternifolia]|uniref:BolA-like protein n=1 Tax=Buddleja alternifolia TaxID=168488 RepID=A0AAV6YCI7_9LAMI|nr:hypothetical protein BUALT_Bualt01G0088200 [Buddleja alternifolia]